MDNVFQKKKSLTLKDFQEQKSHREERKQALRESFNSASSQKFQNKLSLFAKEEETQTILEAFKNGAFPLINPSLHNHRDRQKEKERDEYGGIYVRNYQEAKDRASQTQQSFVSTHLEGRNYNDKQPHLFPTESWLRTRDLKKEGPSLRYGLRIENEQIVKNIDNKMEEIDHSERKMEMVHNPDWKKQDKNKWINPGRGFDNSTKSSLIWSSNPPWPLIPVCPLDPYMGGFKQIEEKLGRVRNRKKEPKRNGFIGRVKDDPWESTLSVSKSVRTFKADEVLHGDKEKLIFSKNNKLDQSSYKLSLIETKSVDRIIPFNHSNNFQSLQLKNIGQNYPRIYKNSLTHYGLLDHQQKGSDTSGNYYSSFLNDNPNKSGNGSRGSYQYKESSQSPYKKHYEDQKQASKGHQISIQSIEKNKRMATQQNLDFRYNPPTDKQVQDAVGKYF